MFYTKKIMTLSLLLTGVVGTIFGSETPKPSAWTRTSDASSKVKKEDIQRFSTQAEMFNAFKPTYDLMGDLREDQIASIKSFTGKRYMTKGDAINYLLSIHPSSPELRRSPSKVSPSAALTPRDVAAMSPLTLSGLK